MKILLSLLINFLLSPSICFGGVSFDGIDDYLNCNSDISLDNLYIYTVCATFKIDTTPTGNFDIVSKYVSQGSIPLEINNSKNIVSWWGASSAGMLARSSNVISTNTWYKICNTFDNTGDRKGRIYLNGIEVSYTTKANASGTLESDSSNNLEIGRGVVSRYFDGIISDVAIWSSILSSQEILQYGKSNVKRNALQLSPSTLVAYWALNEHPDETSGDSDTFYDKSRNINNCTGSDGANNTGLTAKAEEILSYP